MRENGIPDRNAGLHPPLKMIINIKGHIVIVGVKAWSGVDLCMHQDNGTAKFSNRAKALRVVLQAENIIEGCACLTASRITAPFEIDGNDMARSAKALHRRNDPRQFLIHGYRIRTRPR